MSEDKGKKDGTELSEGSDEDALTAKAQGGSPAETAAEEVDLRRRALIRAGWAVPVITAVPGLAFNAAYAQSPHGDSHSDSSHSDAGHTDAGHTDAGHADIHGDAPHGDSHGDDHGDVAHSDIDVAHVDTTILHVDGTISPHVDTPTVLHIDSHTDGSFLGVHGDLHVDIPAFVHGDLAPTHGDDPGLHTDFGHLDNLILHGDTHTDEHVDVG